MRHRELFCLTLQDRKQTSFNDGGGIMGLGNRRILRIHTVSSLSEEGSIAVNFGFFDVSNGIHLTMRSPIGAAIK